jgi:CRP-like cAMP-binding protein
MAQDSVFSSAEPDWLEGLAQRRVLARGELVFRVRAPARHVFYLLHGRVVLHRFGPAGEEVVIHTAAPGEFFAEASMHSERYHCSASAAVASEVAVVPSNALREALASDAAFAARWAAILSRQLRRARARVERLSLRGATDRVRHLLITEGAGSRPTLRLQGTTRELAGELGLTHEALYRTLAAMARSGEIAREGATLVLLR